MATIFRFPTAAEIEQMAKDAGLSIPALCKAADVRPSVFYRWRNGESGTVHMDIAERLVKAASPQT